MNGVKKGFLSRIKEMRRSVKLLWIFVIILGLVVGYFGYRYISYYRMFDSAIEIRSDIFKSGEEGYKCFRIPALLVIPGVGNDGNDVLLAFAEGRRNSCSDYGDIDLVMKRSTDGGRTWSELKVLWNAGEYAVQNPMPIYDNETGTVILGVVYDRSEQYFLRSEDFGVTWSKPEHLDGVKPENWRFFGCCPGHGLITDSGRIIFPGMFTAESDSDWGSFVLYSDDHGKTWSIGHVFPHGSGGTNEWMCADLGNGTVMGILRPNERGTVNYVKLAFSSDGGLTFDTPMPNSDLLTPVCQSSVIGFRTNGSDLNTLIFCGPDSSIRERLSLKVSNDGGKTWIKTVTIFGGWSAYSDIGIVNKGDGGQYLGCLFENGVFTASERITYVALDINYVLNG